MTILEQMATGEAPSFVPLTVEQYHKMIEQGILRDGDPIELIDGLLVRKDRADKGGNPMSHGPRHTSGVRRLNRVFRVVEESGFFLHSQLPVTLGNIQEPEPDLAVVRGRPEDYDQRLPSGKDVAAIMEVSDSSLRFDRTTKQRLYAAAAIPVYWIVNLIDNLVEVYQNPDPANGCYAPAVQYRPNQTLTLVLDRGVEINVAVADLLPA